MKTVIPELEATRNHPWNKRLFKKLTADDLTIIKTWFAMQDGLDKNQYFHNLHRMFLDMPNKPKNWALISEILSNMGTLKYKGD